MMIKFALSSVLLMLAPPAPPGAERMPAQAKNPAPQAAVAAPAAADPAPVPKQQSFRSTSRGNGKEDSGLTILDPEVYQDQEPQSLLPEFHVVSPGETMWGLTGKYYRDPYQWPLIWSINEQITNAHWIFPGDRLRVREGDGSGASAKAGQQRSGVRYAPRSRAKKAPQSYLVQRSFFLFDEALDRVGKVVGSNRPSVMLSEGDTLYLSYDKANPPLPGERLAVYKEAQDVRDYRVGFRGKLRRGKKIAKLVEIAAEVQVERLDEKSASVRVVDSLRPVERGMWVGPLQPRFERMRQEDATVDRKGMVVSCIDGRGMSGQRQFVVLNIGEQAGARPGNLISVIRHGDAYAPINRRDARDREGHPGRTLATMVVVQTSQKASLAMLVDAVVEVRAGDPVLLLPASQARLPNNKDSLAAPSR